jgi:hypothetical protein
MRHRRDIRRSVEPAAIHYRDKRRHLSPCRQTGHRENDLPIAPALGREREPQVPYVDLGPDDEEKQAVTPGRSVKLFFSMRDGWGERMWVRVDAVDGHRLVGTLDTDLIGTPRLGWLAGRLAGPEVMSWSCSSAAGVWRPWRRANQPRCSRSAGTAPMTSGLPRCSSPAACTPTGVWAIEGCNGIGKHIAHRLAYAGEVVDVPSKLSAQVRFSPPGTVARPIRWMRTRWRWSP